MTVAPPDNEVLWARGLVKSYDGSPALRGVSLGIREGEILAVTGPRGCGKSTLLDCLSGQTPPDEGEVWFTSTPVHTLSGTARERLRREHFGWIGTEPRLVPELTAWENAALPLLLLGTPHKAARAAAEEWLERLDIADCARRRPARLLQAQRQRVAIARALVARPAVLFADEPTAPLHHTDRGQVLRTLAAAGRSHRITIVIATHDPDIASYADRTLALLDGRRAGGSDQPLPVTGPVATAVTGRPTAVTATPAPAPAPAPSGAMSGGGAAVAPAPVDATALGGTEAGAARTGSVKAGAGTGTGTGVKTGTGTEVRAVTGTVGAGAGGPAVSGRTTIGTALGAGLEGANRCSASA